MAEIQLTQGQVTQVDDSHAKAVEAFGWRARFSPCTGTYYAFRRKSSQPIPLHDFVWELANGPIPDGCTIDHRDRDTLNNRLENLRLATRREQGLNRRTQLNNTSGYRGVSWHKPSGKWQARTKVARKEHCLGFFTCEMEAALAYDKFLWAEHRSEFTVYNVL